MTFTIKKGSRESLRDLTRKQYREWKQAKANQINACKYSAWDEYEECIKNSSDARDIFINSAIKLIKMRRR